MEAVIFTGIPGTGKSTFYKARFFRTHIRINLDMLKTRYREDLFLRTCIEAKQAFVVDNTNPTAEERSKYIGLARTGGFRVVGYYFQSKAVDALARNAQRPLDERVPESGIFGKLKQLQRPALSEGFDALYYVSITPTGEFHTQEWNDEL